MEKFRERAAFGKREEFAAIAELLRRGFDVYQTLVDDQQIDCVVRRKIGGKPVYMDVQIKARSLKAAEKDAGRFAALEVHPRENYFFIFYSEQVKAYWVFPSRELVKAKVASKNKTGKNKGKYSIVLTNNGRKARGSR